MPAEAAPQRPRQAFVLGWPFAGLGGVNEVVRNLVREFQGSGGLAPLVIETSDSDSEQTLLDGVPLVRMRVPTVYDPRRPLRTLLKFCVSAPLFIRRIGILCKTYEIEVLNPHFIGLEYFALMLFRRLGGFSGKLVLSFHGSDIRSMIQSRGLERTLARLLLRGADVLVPCSRDLGEEILMLAPECAGRIVPVSNGIDIDRFVSASVRDVQLPESMGQRRLILNVGAFEYKKGHHILIEAFAELKQTRSDICLVIAGQKREVFDATRKLITELKLEGDVILLTDLPHASVAGLLQSADLFVLSSRWEKGFCGEGFAMALLEAAAAQKPVVSTLTCGVAELIENGDSGLIVPAANSHLLAQAIETMLNDPGEAARQARNLHARVARDFTWRAAHEAYLALSGFSSSTREVAGRSSSGTSRTRRV